MRLRYERFNNLKNKNREIKTLLAVGGWNAGSQAFSPMVASIESRLLFVNSVIDFLRKHGFDGLDLDWEYPTRRGGRPEDKENFAKLVKVLYFSSFVLFLNLFNICVIVLVFVSFILFWCLTQSIFISSSKNNLIEYSNH